MGAEGGELIRGTLRYIQKFLVDAFLSGKKSAGSKVIARVKGTKIVALLKGTCNDSDPHLKFCMGKVTQIFTNVLGLSDVLCSVTCQEKGEH